MKNISIRESAENSAVKLLSEPEASSVWEFQKSLYSVNEKPER
jgi:hypothetical protein